MITDTKKRQKEYVKRIEGITNKTENKIDVLQTVLEEYVLVPDSNSNSIVDLITEIKNAKNKRKNVSKQYLHKEFLRIKELSLLESYTHSLNNFNEVKSEI